MKNTRKSQEYLLKHTEIINVNFFDADPLGIVWHGNYLKYFEIAREGFGRIYGLSYLNMKNNGFATPIIKTTTEHNHPLKYGDQAHIEINLLKTEAAKLMFVYQISNQNQKIVCTGETVQVFTDLYSGELSLTYPTFFIDWKKRNGL